jgi:hypothetical protein
MRITVTEDNARKRSIRRRMELSGEKYTEAGRALLGGPRSDGLLDFPWLSVRHWEARRDAYPRLVAEHGAAVARGHIYSQMLSVQLSGTLNPYRISAMGRAPEGPDGWMFFRGPAESDAAVIAAAAPLAAVGFEQQLARSRKICELAIDRIDVLSAGASQHARERAATRRSTLGVRPASTMTSCAPRRSGGARAAPPTSAAVSIDLRDRLLRDPSGSFMRRARPAIEDPVIGRLVDEWLEDLDANYRELVAGIPPGWAASCELDSEATSDATGQDPSMVRLVDGLLSPVVMSVQRRHRGGVADVERVAAPIVVADGRPRPQPGGIAVRGPGELWRVRGHRLEDGIVMPRPGSHLVSRLTA